MKCFGGAPRAQHGDPDANGDDQSSGSHSPGDGDTARRPRSVVMASVLIILSDVILVKLIFFVFPVRS